MTNNSLKRVSSHPLYQSISVAPHMFEKYLLESHRVALDDGARYGLRLLHDGIDITARKKRDHAPLLLNRFDAAFPSCGHLHLVRKHHSEPLVACLDVIQGA